MFVSSVQEGGGGGEEGGVVGERSEQTAAADKVGKTMFGLYNYLKLTFVLKCSWGWPERRLR